MIGTHNGMEAETKKHCKHADFCPCVAHALYLVGELANSCCTEPATFFRLSMNFTIFFRHILIAGKP